MSRLHVVAERRRRTTTPGITPETRDLPNGDTAWLTYAGSGIHVDIMAGIELLRASTMRLFVQGEVSLPTYLADAGELSFSDSSIDAEGLDEVYVPTFNISVGIGLGRRNAGRR